MAATSLCRQLQVSMYGWSIQIKRAATARIDKMIASCVVRRMDRLLTKG